jgi:hypothetical protein
MSAVSRRLMEAFRGSARVLEGWEDACPPVGLPELLYSSLGDALDQC